MEIPQDGPTGSHALENADDQNAIGLISPKSHTNSYRMLSTWESMRFKFDYERLMYWDRPPIFQQFIRFKTTRDSTRREEEYSL